MTKRKNVFRYEKIRQRRKERKETIVDVSKEVELSAWFLSLIERGKSSLSVDRLLRICDHYEISAASLFDHIIDREAEKPRKAYGTDLSRKKSDYIRAAALEHFSWECDKCGHKFTDKSRLYVWHKQRNSYGSETFADICLMCDECKGELLAPRSMIPIDDLNKYYDDSKRKPPNEEDYILPPELRY